MARWDLRHRYFKLGVLGLSTSSAFFFMGFAIPAWTNDYGLWMDCSLPDHFNCVWLVTAPSDVPVGMQFVRGLECLALFFVLLAMASVAYMDCRQPHASKQRRQRDSTLPEFSALFAGAFGVIGSMVFATMLPLIDTGGALRRASSKHLGWGFWLVIISSSLFIVFSFVVAYFRFKGEDEEAAFSTERNPEEEPLIPEDFNTAHQGSYPNYSAVQRGNETAIAGLRRTVVVHSEYSRGVGHLAGHQGTAGALQGHRIVPEHLGYVPASSSALQPAHLPAHSSSPRSDFVPAPNSSLSSQQSGYMPAPNPSLSLQQSGYMPVPNSSLSTQQSGYMPVPNSSLSTQQSGYMPALIPSLQPGYAPAHCSPQHGYVPEYVPDIFSSHSGYMPAPSSSQLNNGPAPSSIQAPDYMPSRSSLLSDHEPASSSSSQPDYYSQCGQEQIEDPTPTLFPSSPSAVLTPGSGQNSDN